VVQEVSPEGKPVNSRSYSTTVVTNSHDASVIRANSRVPIATGTYSDGATTSTLVNQQFQYQNVGVEINVRNAHEVGRLLTLNLNADVSSLGGSAPVGGNVHQPIMRQNKWEAAVLVPIGKSTVVFNSDDLDNKGSMQMLVTATLLQ
jgi:type II secretory pathway component GspD/PulD (secretin)